MMHPLTPGLDKLAEQLADESMNIEIPDPMLVDLGPADLASLVARTANSYGRAARLAGMARAEAKRAKARYDYVLKRNRVGNNDAEREAHALAVAEEEHTLWTDAEQVAAVADGIESAARVASESARKILDKIESLGMAAAREQAGAYREGDFAPY
jgi:hypothetical protein